MDNIQRENMKNMMIQIEAERLKMCQAANKLERRERIATAILSGLLANSALNLTKDDLMTEARQVGSKQAILFADALIKALDQKENE